MQLSIFVLSVAISYPTHRCFHFCVRASKQIIVLLASWIVCALLYISCLGIVFGGGDLGCNDDGDGDGNNASNGSLVDEEVSCGASIDSVRIGSSNP